MRCFCCAFAGLTVHRSCMFVLSACIFNGRNVLALLTLFLFTTALCEYYEASWQYNAWWRHQMETFSAQLAMCAGNSPVPGEFPTQRPMTRSFDVSFDLRLNKRLGKKSWGWWFETRSCPLRRHCNGMMVMRNQRYSVANASEITMRVLRCMRMHREGTAKNLSP